MSSVDPPGLSPTHDQLVERLCELAAETARRLNASDQRIGWLEAENRLLRAECDKARSAVFRLNREES
jgi:hypothetical protein